MAWWELVVFNPGSLVVVMGAATVLNRRRIVAQAGSLFGGRQGASVHPTPSRHVAVFGVGLIVLGLFLFVVLLME